MNREISNEPAREGPSFTPNRLVIARQCRGLTKTQLAKKIDVTPQAVAQYEAGIILPKHLQVHSIAEELGFDTKFFYEEDIHQIEPDAVSFRSRRAMTASVRDRTLAASAIAESLVSKWLHYRFRLPKVSVPNLSAEHPEVAADFLRARWQLGRGPIDNMVHVIEANGVEVYWFDEVSKYVNAVSFWRDNKPFILISKRSRGGERVRFDIAHELGHLVLHKNVSTLDAQEVEKSANEFASAFLLPRSQFRQECPMFPMLRQFLHLKPRWKTSVQAMIYRSRDLGLLSAYHYQKLFRELSAQWGRTSEPCRLTCEESAIHKEILNRLATKSFTSDDLADEILLPISDLCSLVPAAEKYRRSKNETVERKRLTIEELGYKPQPWKTQLPPDKL